MVNYLYRCADRHETTVNAALGQAAAQVDCPCGMRALRVFTAPMLSTTDTPHRRSVETAEASAERPAVTGRPPPARQSPQPPSDPRHAYLPRP